MHLEECGRLDSGGLHFNGPGSVFTPLDNHKERYESDFESFVELLRTQFPSKESLLAQRNHIIETPTTTFTRYTLPTA